MKEETLFPTIETKYNLKHLENLIPGIHPTIAEFGRYLGESLPAKVTAMDFILYVITAIQNLEKGLDHSGKPLDHILTKQEKMIYIILRNEIPEIINVIFPKKFGAEVQEALEKMNA